VAPRFIKLIDSTALDELVRTSLDAFGLLTLIAKRACRKTGQAKIGDYKACNLTERRYRSAKERLARDGQATFKATNRGTIATLLKSDIYEINKIESDEPAASQPRASREPATTNKNKEVRIKNKKDTEVSLVSESGGLNGQVLKKDILIWWNEIAESNGLCKIRAITADRWQKFKARNREGLWENREDVAKAIAESEWLKGKNDRGWKADFDFVVKSELHLTRLLEGQYKGKKRESWEL